MVRINNIFNGAVNNDLNDIPQFDLTNNLLHDSVYANMFHDLNLSCQYYSESAVRDEINNINNNFFSLFSVNIQSLASKFNELINFISKIIVYPYLLLS